MKRHHWKRFLPICVTLGIMAIVIAKSDWRHVAARFAQVDPGWLAAAVTLFVPLVLLSSLRWRAMVRPWCRLSVREACAQVLAASALNLALPSKLGDFSKAAFLREQAAAADGGAPGPADVCATAPRDAGPTLVEASAVVVAEKAIDIFALVVLVALGMALQGHWRLATLLMSGLLLATGLLLGQQIVRRRRRNAMGGKTRVRPLARWRQVIRGAVVPLARWRWGVLVFILWSWGLWLLHLTQMALLFRAAGIDVPFERVLARVPLAVVAGLVPWTVAGIGTRDSALLVLFSDTAPAAALAVVGMLTALRYLVPGAVGLPILYRRFGRAALPAPQRDDASAVASSEREIRVPAG